MSASNVLINVPGNDASTFGHILSVAPASTTITISNNDTAGGDILLKGTIDNPSGSTTIVAKNGAITGQAGEQVLSKTLALQATGAISGPGGALNIGVSAGGSLSAAAGIGAKAGNLTLLQAGGLTAGTVSAPGTVTLNASGNITNGVSVSAPVIVLGSQSGAIGGGVNAPLNVDNNGGQVSLSASAAQGVSINGGQGGISAQTFAASAGDVFLSVVPDTFTANQTIVLPATARVSAASGNVTLNASDAIIMTQGATISAGKTVTIQSDLAHQESGGGSQISLTDAIVAASVVVSGGPGTNVFNITGVRSPTTLNTGNATVNVGSNAILNAIVNTPTPGTLGKILSGLTINPNSGHAFVNLDDGGDTANTPAGASVHFVNGILTVPNAAGSITLLGSEAATLTLGSGAVAVAVDSTPAGLSTTIGLGTGADQVTVGTGQVTAIKGPVTVAPNATPGSSGTLTIDDHSITGDTGTLAAIGVSGFGLPAGGIGWTGGGLASLDLKLGKNATIAVTDQAQATTIDTTAGGETVNIVSTTLGAFAQPLTVAGGANTTLNVTDLSPSAAPLSVSSSGAGQITIAGPLHSGVPEPDIIASGITAFAITQTAPGDALSIGALPLGLSITENGGGASVSLGDATGLVTIALHKGGNSVTVAGGAGGVTVTTDKPGTDTVTIDRSAVTTPINGQINSAAGDVATVTGVLDNGATLTATAMGSIGVLLGTGNNSFIVNNGFKSTTVSVTGGPSQNNFTVNTDATRTTFTGGASGFDTLTAVIPGAPQPGQFSNVFMNNIGTLIVDNSNFNVAHNGTAVAWERDAQPTGSHLGTFIAGTPRPGTPPAGLNTNTFVDVVETQGATITKIIGGMAADTLVMRSDSNADETGTINGDTVELDVSPNISATLASDTIPDLTGAVTFDGISSAVASYSGDGKIVVTAVDPAGATSPTLVPIYYEQDPGVTGSAANTAVVIGDKNGNPFSLSGLTLSSFSNISSVTLFYTTINGLFSGSPSSPGNAGQLSIPVLNGAYTFPTTLSGLASAWLTPGPNVRVDSIFAQEAFVAPAGVTYTAAPTIDFTGNVTFNTTSGAPQVLGVFTSVKNGITTSGTLVAADWSGGKQSKLPALTVSNSVRREQRHGDVHLRRRPYIPHHRVEHDHRHRQQPVRPGRNGERNDPVGRHVQRRLAFGSGHSSAWRRQRRDGRRRRRRRQLWSWGPRWRERRGWQSRRSLLLEVQHKPDIRGGWRLGVCPGWDPRRLGRVEWHHRRRRFGRRRTGRIEWRRGQRQRRSGRTVWRGRRARDSWRWRPGHIWFGWLPRLQRNSRRPGQRGLARWDRRRRIRRPEPQ